MMKRAADYCVEIDSEKVDVVGLMQCVIGARVWRTSAMTRFLTGVPLVRVFGSGRFPRVPLRSTARLSQSAVSPLKAAIGRENDTKWCEAFTQQNFATGQTSWLEVLATPATA